METLGSDLVRVRIRRVLEVLGGIPGRKLDWTYGALFGPGD
jgi:hypothetical protein